MSHRKRGRQDYQAAVADVAANLNRDLVAQSEPLTADLILELQLKGMPADDLRLLVENGYLYVRSTDSFVTPWEVSDV